VKAASGLLLLDAENILKTTIDTTIALLGFTLYLVAAYGDIRSLRIPNLLVAAVAVLGIGRLVLIGDPASALYTVGASLLVLVVGFVLFSRRYIGGGDAKLLTATVLLIGYHDLFSFLFLMSICGAALSLLILARHRRLKSRPVPYGVAIAAAGTMTLFLQSSHFG
jgi:prepilin peptidase CpaA